MNSDTRTLNGRSGEQGFLSYHGERLLLSISYADQVNRMILSVIFLVQVSMNFNTSLYSDAIPGISKEFGVSEQAARCGAMIFLVLYAFGCELVSIAFS
jgi:hypothetical protein